MSRPDLICFSHLRWDFVWQRPQHLMTRASEERRVWFVEEPLKGPAKARVVAEAADRAPSGRRTQVP